MALVVGELLLAEHDRFHLARLMLDKRLCLALKSTGHAPLAKRLESAGRTFRNLFFLIVSTDGLVELFAHVKRIETVVIDVGVIVSEPKDIPGMVKKDTVVD